MAMLTFEASKRFYKTTRNAIGQPRVRFQRIWRAVRGFGRGILDYPAAWFGLFRPRDGLATAVAELLVVGFYGATSRSFSARLLARQVQRGQVGGVFFVNQNVGTIDELTDLMRLFRTGDKHPLIAIDHEGGVVQRLTRSHGFTPLPAARTVAQALSPSQARQLYAIAGKELAAFGFNINLGPVLDVDDPKNPAIGRLRRSYGTEPERIVAYAESFTSGFASAGIHCAAKHFPGHGRSAKDSHYEVADISAHWTEAELEPFARLIASPHAPAMVMTGHLYIDHLATDGRPATISAPITTGLLRQKLGFKGVVITDDIDMDALSNFMSRKEAMVGALAAGNDLVMIKNLFGYDPLLPQRAVRWVREAIAEGLLSEVQITESVKRVRAIRQKVSQGRSCSMPDEAASRQRQNIATTRQRSI